jgi:hypothetical protein
VHGHLQSLHIAAKRPSESTTEEETSMTYPNGYRSQKKGILFRAGQTGITFACLGLALLPTWIFIALWHALAPTTFWEKIIIIYVCGGFAAVLQIWFLAMYVSILTIIWD